MSKKLEKGTFKRVRENAEAGGRVEIDVTELTLMLEGVDVETVHRRPRWKKPKPLK